MKTTTWVRPAIAGVGVAPLVSVGSAAFANSDGAVDVDVEITPLVPTGELALSVAPGTVALEEDGSTAEMRQFTGTLPTITVTDTRSASDIAPEAAWVVLGSASAFVGDADQPELTPDHLGWTPRLTQSSESGLVAPGDPVGTVLDEGEDAVGLVDQEILALAADSGDVATEGTWSATADLFLRTPADVAPGSYSAILTLSLME